MQWACSNLNTIDFVSPIGNVLGEIRCEVRQEGFMSMITLTPSGADLFQKLRRGDVPWPKATESPHMPTPVLEDNSEAGLCQNHVPCMSLIMMLVWAVRPYTIHGKTVIRIENGDHGAFYFE